MAASLTFNSNGQFKIVQFTDLHWADGGDNNRKTLELMERVIAEEQPDLVVVTGDVIEDGCCTDPSQSIREAVGPMEKSGTPWALVFGNHDSEARISREHLLASLAGVQHSLTERGPYSITGIGNYIIRLNGRDGNLVNALFFMDSGDYAEARIGGYAGFQRDQINWFARESESLAGENGGVPVPAMAFFHIPLPEYNDAWDFHLCYGHKREQVCCPLINTGMFATMVQAGNVYATFAGHDHDSDFYGEMFGISLGYGRKTGYNNYMREDLAKGARVIVLEEGVRGFRTWLRLDNGETMEQSAHLPEGRK
ncbi:metallophosphoesterase family protein [Cohnella yongneupensis]|uniref:Metallophosphoesterase family protein n=1 Tax=Cohnella yongneupensis TaxID=425006 RepID=A0ABW0QUF1_9BACL